MPRAPTACRIGRSRLALLAHLLPAAAAAGLLVLVLPIWGWLPAAFGLVALAIWCARHPPQGELSAEALPGGALQWRWRAAGDAIPQPVSLQCDYLGPWLIGLRLNGRRLWLWPDSCSVAAHRELRRYLIRR
ncbi:protein YgfX [Halomonas sp. SSL-5]|uniref:protein YgfX n=1 Tax=Halomonas sp. SSL-5 TaxID=3065855 RepID=UPI002AA2AA3A|nr:protein YgfX [Halomonas sp. SSL-5]MDY7115125.1 protein YgfX [Halomonas sp. SSL-5]